MGGPEELLNGQTAGLLIGQEQWDDEWVQWVEWPVEDGHLNEEGEGYGRNRREQETEQRNTCRCEDAARNTRLTQHP